MRNRQFLMAFFIFLSIFQSGCSRTETTNQFIVEIQTRHLNDLQLRGNKSKTIHDIKSADLGAIAWTMGGAPVFARGFLKFDLSELPPKALIVSAKLSLYSNPQPGIGDHTHANFGNNNALVIERVLGDWDSTTTWLQQPPSDTASQIIVPQATLPSGDLLDVDVKHLVKDMIRKGNHGFMIRLQKESLYNSRIFCSGKHEMIDKHPKLVLTYLN